MISEVGVPPGSVARNSHAAASPMNPRLTQKTRDSHHVSFFGLAFFLTKRGAFP